MRVLKKELWPYQIVVTDKDLLNDALQEKVHKWCHETIGLRFKHWYSYRNVNGSLIYAFKDEATLLVFKLRWRCK